MGIYDIFVYNCPNCNKETSSQTKLGECGMSHLRIGDEFPINGAILMKNSCENCGADNVVVIKRGIIVRFEKEGEEDMIVFVYRRQQEKNEAYEIEAQNQKEFQISTWEHKGFDTPRIWRNWWCKDHKTIAFSVYVPSQTNIITFDSLSTFRTLFDREN